MDSDAAAILTIAVSAPAPATIRDITEYCDKVLRRRLETVSGVGQVMIVGGQARQINVHEVHVRAVAHARNRHDELKMVTVPSNKFGTVPLGDVVRFEKGTGPACKATLSWRSL